MSVPWWAFLFIALVAILLLTNGYWLGRHCKAKQRRHDHTLALGLELERLSRRGPYSYPPSHASGYNYPSLHLENGYPGAEHVAPPHYKGVDRHQGAPDVILPGESRLSSRHPSELGYGGHYPVGTKQHLYERINPLGIQLPYDQQGSLLSLASSSGPYLGAAGSSSTDPETTTAASERAMYYGGQSDQGMIYPHRADGYDPRRRWTPEQEAAMAAAASDSLRSGSPRSQVSTAPTSHTSSRWRRLFRRRSTVETPPVHRRSDCVDTAGPRVESWLPTQGAPPAEHSVDLPTRRLSSNEPPPLPPRVRAYSTDGRRGAMYLPEVAARSMGDASEPAVQATSFAGSQDQPGIYSSTNGVYLEPGPSQEHLRIGQGAPPGDVAEYLDISQDRRSQRPRAASEARSGPPSSAADDRSSKTATPVSTEGSERADATGEGHAGAPSPSKWVDPDALVPTQAMLALVKRTGLATSRGGSRGATSRSLGDLSRLRAADGRSIPRAVENTDGGSAPVQSESSTPAIVVKDAGSGYEQMSPIGQDAADGCHVAAGLDIPPAPLVGTGHMYERLEGGKLPRTRSINFSAATLQNEEGENGDANDDDPEEFYSLLGSEAVGGGEVTAEARSLFRLGDDVHAAADKLASAVANFDDGLQRGEGRIKEAMPPPADNANGRGDAERRGDESDESGRDNLRGDLAIFDDDDEPRLDPFRRAVKHRSSGKSVSSAIHWASEFVSQFANSDTGETSQEATTLGADKAQAASSHGRRKFQDSV